LEVELTDQLDAIAAEIAGLKEGGELTHQRMRTALGVICGYCEAANVACNALDLLASRERLATPEALS
jgi:hypothetical protein